MGRFVKQYDPKWLNQPSQIQFVTEIILRGNKQLTTYFLFGSTIAILVGWYGSVGWMEHTLAIGSCNKMILDGEFNNFLWRIYGQPKLVVFVFSHYTSTLSHVKKCYKSFCPISCLSWSDCSQCSMRRRSFVHWNLLTLFFHKRTVYSIYNMVLIININSSLYWNSCTSSKRFFCKTRELHQLINSNDELFKRNIEK